MLMLYDLWSIANNRMVQLNRHYAYVRLTVVRFKFFLQFAKYYEYLCCKQIFVFAFLIPEFLMP